MKKKSKVLIVLFATIFLAAGITFAYAAVAQNTATNVVTVGKVSIELINEDEVVSGGAISAGEMVSKKVKVKNTGNYPAYVRMKIKKEWTSTSTETVPVSKLSSDAIVPDCKSDWVKGKGEDSSYSYYYYQNVLPAGATVDFMDNYYVSAKNIELLKDYHGSSISIGGKMTVQAEAIQSEFLETEVLEKDKNNNIVNWAEISFDGFVEDTTTPAPATAAAVTGTAVHFDKNADKFVTFKDGNTDLFLSTKGMLPGKEVKQELEVKNTSNEKTEVFLSAQLPENVTAEELAAYRELLEYLEIHIVSDKGDELYEGNLLEHATDGKPISLGVFSPNAGYKLTITVKLSTKWKKASCQTKVLWIFSTEKKGTVPDNPGDGGVLPPASTEAPTPTVEATQEPAVTLEPTVTPELTVTPESTETQAPTAMTEPTKEPIVTEEPTMESTAEPTKEPTKEPEGTKPPTSEPLVVPGDTEEPKATNEPTPTSKPRRTTEPNGIGLFASPEVVPTIEPAPTSKVTHDKTKPKPNVPVERPTKTGDSTPIIFWAVMGVLSLIGCVVSGKKIITGRK